MNCRDFEMNVRALVRTELLDGARRDLLLGHAAACLQCSDRLAAEQALVNGVRAVVAELREQKAPDHVRAALLTTFRKHTSIMAGNRVIPMPQKVARHWRLEAAAAAILILVSITSVLWIYSGSSIEKQVALSAPSLPVPAEKPSGLVVENDIEIADPATANHRISRHRAARRNSGTNEEVTEFFPLMDGIDLDSLEAVQAVRVELPASALNDLGFQTDREAPTGPIKADVLLGHDGLARAIRFVR
jgi:hypothetical protein